MTFEQARARLTGKRLEVYESLQTIGPTTAALIAKDVGCSEDEARAHLSELITIQHAEMKPGKNSGKQFFRALMADEIKAALESSPEVRAPAVWIPAPDPIEAKSGEQFTLL